MIQKYNIKSSLSQRANNISYIDEFHNPYLSKLILKIIPIHLSTNSIVTYRWLAPYSTMNDIILSQSLPIYTTQRVYVSLLWKQSTLKYQFKQYMGLLGQYKFLQYGLSLRYKQFIGNNSISSLTLHKTINKNTYAQLFIQLNTKNGSNIIEQNKIGCNFFYKNIHMNLYTILYRQNQNIKNMKIQFKHQLSQKITLETGLQIILPLVDKIIFWSSLSYAIDDKGGKFINCIEYNNDNNEIIYKFQLNKSFNKNSSHQFIITTQYIKNNSIIYLGYRTPSLNFIFPIFVTTNIIPIIISGIGYILGYFLNSSKTKIKSKQQYLHKTIQNRIQQLKLISDKSTQIYQRQCSSNDGLIINFAYIGPKNLLEQLSNENKYYEINTNEKYKNDIFDITVTMRFYVIKNQLKLPQGNKDHLLGFFNPKKDNYIHIDYQHHHKHYYQIIDCYKSLNIGKL